MVDWETELKNYITKKIKDTLGEDVSPDDITNLEMDNITDLTIPTIAELTMYYAFAIMKEDFERADVIRHEFKNRNCKIDLDINEDEKTAVLNVYLKPEIAITRAEIKFKILPDGMMIDFEEQNF